MQTLYDIFLAMGASTFAFYLTGSRFYGEVTAQSDWDFFVLDHANLDYWLLDNGFILLDSHKYNDPATVMVYRHPL